MAAKVKAFVQEIFNIVDKDGSGCLEAPEIKSALEKFAAVASKNKTASLSSEDVTDFADSLDANFDGIITVEDFWLLLLEKSPHTTFEDLEDDLNAHEAEVDASLPELKQQLTALLA
mmetsp:Transcript_27441/g.57056  ORF Transcript_27441/g.57056 Transcript_27441/m.57056 type:complete len:117 (-) Transcript_27441:45-395(-)